MSKGNKVIPFRCPRELEQAINSAIASRNHVTKQEPWDRTGFIIAALKDKLAHLERSKGKKRKVML